MKNTLKVGDFIRPTCHPFGMLGGYDNETVSTLTYLLARCVDAGRFCPIKTIFEHPEMVAEGLLTETKDGRYLLTDKAKTRLYTVFAKIGDTP